MKILYAIQGTGNGHIARAEDVIPALKVHGEVDLFVSGAQADISLNHPIKYKSKGLSFYFGKSGGIDFLKTFVKNSSRDVYKQIHEFPIKQYDVVINDFEPISAWASRKKGIPCVSLSHQAALLSDKVPHPNHFDPVGEWILRNYAPVDDAVGFHFAKFDRNIFTPVIRSSIRKAKITNEGHITVYLPAYGDRKLMKLLSKITCVSWQVFSKHTRKRYQLGNVSVRPVSYNEFIGSMAASQGVLCGAGFETPAEALFLQKKLMVVPMKKQYEQHCNASALREMGIPVIKSMKKKHLKKIANWVGDDKRVAVNYLDETKKAVELALLKARVM
jgi:uncharacterized protein (TIGR00661 family)